MAWQSPHVQRGSAFGSHRDTAADGGVPAGHALRLDQLLAAAAGWGCGAHRANGGPWHQHLDHFTSHQPDKPPKPPKRHQTCGAMCHSGVPQLLLLLDFVRDHVGHWCETSNMSETFSVGQQLTFSGFLAIVLRCLQSTKYKMDQWDHVISCDHMIRSIS